jgi:hypothetical protein
MVNETVAFQANVTIMDMEAELAIVTDTNTCEVPTLNCYKRANNYQRQLYLGRSK